MYDKADVGFIDSQAECCCRNNEGTAFRFELIENALVLLLRQLSVEAQRFLILALEPCSERLCLGYGGAVYDGTPRAIHPPLCQFILHSTI